MPEAAKVVGIVGHIGPYNPKSMEWSTYKGRFTFYLQANSITNAALKRATLLTLIKDTAYCMLADLYLPNELYTVSFKDLITNLDSAYGNKVSKLASRVRFQSIVKHEEQSVDEFRAELRHLSIDCGFGDKLDNRLKDQFVVGLRSEQIKNKLFEDEDRVLANIVKKARDLEQVNRESTSSKPAQTSSFSSHQVQTGSKQPRCFPRVFQPGSFQFTCIQNQHNSKNYSITQPCYRCKTSGHNLFEYKYFTQRLQCKNCGRRGHKALSVVNLDNKEEVD